METKPYVNSIPETANCIEFGVRILLLRGQTAGEGHSDVLSIAGEEE